MGRETPIEELSRWLAENGLHNTTAVDLPGEFSVRTDSYKLIHDIKRDRSKLFDLRRDPREQALLRRPHVVADLREVLDEHIRESTESGTLGAEPGAIPEDLEERLRSLGYLD